MQIFYWVLNLPRHNFSMTKLEKRFHLIFILFNRIHELYLCAIWYHLYNLKNVKNTYGVVLLCKSCTPPWVFSKFFKLHKWYKISTYAKNTRKKNSSSLRHSMPLVSFCNSWKNQKTICFLLFSGGMEKDLGMKWFKLIACLILVSNDLNFHRINNLVC